jgi:hypothetical protein
MMSSLLREPAETGLRLTHRSAQNPAPFMLNPGTAAAGIESVEKIFAASKPGNATRLK